ncbi:UPF0182 family protein [Patescibacteria group bacterium]|nr:UPF0182 family protein [Patescibacteria group bacterium]
MLQRKFIIALIVFLLILLLPSLFHFLTDLWWFKNLGYQNILLTILKTKIFLGLVIGLFSFLILYFNSLFIKKLLKSDSEIITIKPGRQLKLNLGLIYSLVIGLFIGLGSAGQWDVVLKYFNQTLFNVADPIFGKDISFYFFSLPFIQYLVNLGFWLVIFCFVFLVIKLFISKGRSLLDLNKLLFKEEKIKKYFCFLATLFFVLAAVHLRLIRIPSLIYRSPSSLNGAGYADLHAVLPFLKALFFISLLAVIAFLVNIFKESRHLIFFSIGLYLIVAIVGVWLAPSLLQRFVVLPNELVKETPYIEYGIAATRQAFALDRVVERELSGETSLSMNDINENVLTIKNVRLWDREPLLDTFGQIQEIRTYYDFISIDNDRYLFNGDYRQVLLSPRELNSASLPQRNFINEQLTFTHGYGLTLGPVNEVTPEGLPVLFLKDLPPVSSIESLAITQPGIYYGELSNEYVIVNTRSKEFDYPAGDENVFANYQGKGGVKLDSFFKKLLFAMKFNSLKIILSNDITQDSRIMYYRDVSTRLKKLLPFLRFDDDPYLVITNEGKLKWIADAYTLSNRYPYSQSIQYICCAQSEGFIVPQRLNYIRNSAKVVMDAYNGDMQIYLADSTDPMIQTFSKIFKNTFLPLSEMDDYLRTHLRYPEEIFNYQTKIYSIYHMGEVQIFYNKEDQWEIPTISSQGGFDPMMRRMIMKLPEEDKEEFILMIPFTPRGKDNLSAWMVARNDGEYYGELVVYRFPKQKLVFGPKQITNRINQDTEISQQLTLWDQRGSQVIKGNLLVIPIEKSLLYVQPIYLKAEGGRIPELKRVIVAYENKIAMEEGLDLALERIFSGQIKKTPVTALKELKAITSDKDLIQQAKQHYDNALKAQQKGDWALYGQEIEKLGKVLKSLPQ